LIQGLDVFKLVDELQPTCVNFVVRERMKHESIVWVWAMAYAQDGIAHWGSLHSQAIKLFLTFQTVGRHGNEQLT
jgi:hypothetical protein